MKPDDIVRELERCKLALRMILKITGNALIIRCAKNALEGKDSSNGK